MESIDLLSPETARSIRAVLTDIDGTLTNGGRMPARSHAALERLRGDGLVVIPVTGRPAGWCDLIARQWCVDAVIGENGALWFRYDEARGRLTTSFVRSASDRIADRAKLDQILREVLVTVPGTAPASDQDYRVTDLAIDYCEDVPPLDERAVARILDIFKTHGATAKVSSIHVNGWFGSHDKLTSSLKVLAEDLDIDASSDPGSVMFIGDSPNDAPMFGYFPNAVGVANVRAFAHSIEHLPHFVTHAEGAEGFAEFAEAFIARRRT